MKKRQEIDYFTFQTLSDMGLERDVYCCVKLEENDCFSTPLDNNTKKVIAKKIYDYFEKLNVKDIDKKIMDSTDLKLKGKIELIEYIHNLLDKIKLPDYNN